MCVCVCVCMCARARGCVYVHVCMQDSIRILCRAVRYHLKFAYHDSIVRVSRYTLGIDTSHDMAYMR